MKNNRFISSIWNFNGFSKEELNGSNHDIFRWYGKLVPELVRRLIAMYSDKDDLILANFAGSGTVLVEANHAKRHSVGIDSNPLSHLICKVRITPFTSDYKCFIKEVNDLLKFIDFSTIVVHSSFLQNFYLYYTSSVIIKSIYDSGS